MKLLRLSILALLLPLLQLQGQEIGSHLDSTGLLLDLEQGGAINVRVDQESKLIRLYQVDKDGLVTKPTFARALVLIDPPRDTEEFRLVLRPGQEGPYLSHPRRLYPPYVYRLRVFLYPDEDSDEGRIALPMSSLKQ